MSSAKERLILATGDDNIKRMLQSGLLACFQLKDATKKASVSIPPRILAKFHVSADKYKIWRTSVLKHNYTLFYKSPSCKKKAKQTLRVLNTKLLRQEPSKMHNKGNRKKNSSVLDAKKLNSRNKRSTNSNRQRYMY